MFYGTNRHRPGSRGKQSLVSGGYFGRAPNFMNVGSTAAAPTGAAAVDWQINGVQTFGMLATGQLYLAKGTSPSPGINIFNTVDNPTNPVNYEVGYFNWTSNQFTIGNIPAGTGSPRSLNLSVYGQQINFHSNLNLGGSGAIYNFVGSGCITQFCFNDTGNWSVAIGSGNTNNNGQISLTDGSFIQWVNHGNYGLIFGGIAQVNVASGPGGGSGVLAIGQGFGGAGGWIVYQGQNRLPADVTTTSTALGSTIASVFSVPLWFGRNYSFKACLFSTCSTTGGLQVTLNSTTISGSTDFRWHAYQISNNTITSEVYSTAFGTLVGPLLPSTTNVTTYIEGTISGVQSTGGAQTQANLQIWFAQDVSTATLTSVKRGSYFLIDDMN